MDSFTLSGFHAIRMDKNDVNIASIRDDVSSAIRQWKLTRFVSTWLTLSSARRSWLDL